MLWEPQSGCAHKIQKHANKDAYTATMNIGAHVSFLIMVFSGYMSNSGIAGSYGRFIPSCLRNLQPVFHDSYINIHSHQQEEGIVCTLFVDGHLDQYKVMPHCSFDLHFSHNERC